MSRKKFAPDIADPCHADRMISAIAFAFRRDQSRPHWLRFAGEAEIEMGHFDRAITLLRQSYAANPRHPYLLRSLAAASALSGRMDESRRFLAELNAVAPHVSPERYLNRPAPLRAMQPELNRGLRIALAPPT